MGNQILRSARWKALTVSAVILGLTGAAHAQSSACRPPDVESSRTTSTLKDYVTSTDSFTIRLQNALGITGTPVNKISYSTDPRTCSSAVTALNSRFKTPGLARSVYVWIVGGSYAVEDPSDQLPGGYRAIILFTSKWAFKSAWAPN
jgi:hypothetical protein